MNIKLIEVKSQNNELFFNIYDQDINKNIGILFTSLNHVAYEIYPEYRGQGAATEAVKKLLERIENPILEITFTNIPSIKVAKKAGFTLRRIEGEFGIYEHNHLKR
ncbi:MAG: GNAT family N-acetyltransferase [Firmicutes bacterium]|nr:GNAT family N-acetyltransferase [Bacillota bacterium]